MDSRAGTELDADLISYDIEGLFLKQLVLLCDMAEERENVVEGQHRISKNVATY